MSQKADNIERPLDAALIAHLASAGVRYHRLAVSEHRGRETAWRKIYQESFAHGGNIKQGAKAIDEYLQQRARDWMIVPFLSKVPGTSVHVCRLAMNAFDCHGPLLELGGLIDAEFFVAPPDLSWTFVRTHEDFMFGGPYFAKG